MRIDHKLNDADALCKDHALLIFKKIMKKLKKEGIKIDFTALKLILNNENSNEELDYKSDNDVKSESKNE